MQEKKLFLLDAYALIYRSYYAFIKNPRINSKGVNTSAIFGFVNTLEDVLKKENPSHIAVGSIPVVRLSGTKHMSFIKQAKCRMELVSILVLIRVALVS